MIFCNLASSIQYMTTGFVNMKKIYFVVLLMSCFTVFSQTKDELPGNIKKSFNLKYPDATDISWYKTDSIYVIEFNLFEEHKKVVSDLSGKIIQTYTAIKIKDIPSNIKQVMQSNFSNGTILRSERVRTKKEEIHYIIFVESKESIYSVRLNSFGTILSTKRMISDDLEEIKVMNELPEGFH